MKTARLADTKVTLAIGMAYIALSGPFGMLATTASAQTPVNTQATAASLPPGMVDVIGLTKAGFSEDGILAKVKSAGKSYDLTTEQMIYLKNQGVSENVISALLQAGPASIPPPPVNTSSVTPPPMPPPVASVPPSTPASVPSPSDVPPEAGNGQSPTTSTTPPPAEPVVNFDYFHNQLAPYGHWVDIGGGTMYWHPDQAIAANPDWRPYYDMGQWVHTDNGLFWQSDYTWGDIPFHYGRWVLDPVQGWLWAPDYTWGPAWVFWRQDEVDAAIGWAPLPVGAVFVGGVLMFHGVAVAADFDFGLGEGCFIFVGYDHFHEGFFRMRGREWAHHIGRERMHGFYGRSSVRNDFRRDEHGRFVNEGIGRDRVERLTKVEHAGSFEERSPVGDRNRLAAQRTEQGPQQGGQGHEQPGRPGGPSPAPVSKVYRPPATGTVNKTGTGEKKSKS